MKIHNEEDNLLYLDHIIEAIEKVLLYTNGLDEESFYKSDMVKDATIRNFEVAGEAAKRLSTEFREKYSHIPWKKITAFRDVLIHDYDEVDLWIVWDTIVNHAQSILVSLKKLLSQLDK